ncbi:MAG: class I SAM-dependent methyltransferase [Sporichthyaceae bacterium]
MTEYALRMSEAEIHRYRRMAQVAREQEAELWTRAGIVPGARVADLGCGPGAALMAMAQVVGPQGWVHGVDGDAPAIEVARSLLAGVGAANASVEVIADVAASGIAPASMDVAVLRHVLAHNGPTEQTIVDHAAELVRPGGVVYLADIEATTIRFRPDLGVQLEMWERYRAWHAARGNDALTGLRLTELLRGADLDIVIDTGYLVVQDLEPGWRSPAWAARQALLTGGFADQGDLARWQRDYEDFDALTQRPRGFFPIFVAAGRKPL